MTNDRVVLLIVAVVAFLSWSGNSMEAYPPPDRAPVTDDGEPWFIPAQFVKDPPREFPAQPEASIQIEPEKPPKPKIVPPSGPPLIPPVELSAKISGPEVARVGDLPIFNVAVAGGTPKLVHWTVDPAVTRMGDDTTRLGIATPVVGQYRIRVFVVDEQWRRTEAQWVCTIDPQGGPSANPTSTKDLSAEWSAQVAGPGVDAFTTLQAILRDVAALIRIEEITSAEQMQATLEDLMEQRLSADQQLALQPWFDKLNAYLEVQKRLGRLRTIQDLEPIFDRVADGLPVPPSL